MDSTALFNLRRTPTLRKISSQIDPTTVKRSIAK
jgi:hypothetical protein